MANKLTVKLDGSEYTLVSDESREYMLEISDMVNRKLTDVKIQNCKLSTSMAALLVALNMADEFKKAEAKNIELCDEIDDLKKRLEAARQYVQNQKNQTPPNKN